MKLLSVIIILAAAMLSGCGSAPNTNSVVNNTVGNANLRGANTNTGYVTNTDTNVKPTIPPNATNLTPGNMSNGNSNSNSRSNSNSNINRNTR